MVRAGDQPQVHSELRPKVESLDKVGFVEPIAVGRVLAPVGLRGEVRIEVLSDVPRRFAPGSVLVLDGLPYKVERSRSAARGMVVKLSGVRSREDAEALRGKTLSVSQADVPPAPADTYYYFQVLGMRVFTVDGQELGEVTEILCTGANDVYVVAGNGRETLVPAVAGVVVQMDVEAQRMTVDLPEGL